MKMNLLNKGKIISVIALCCINILNAQEVLLTLPQEEQLLYAESHLALFDSKTGIQICTVDRQGRFFIYKNNKKHGPFSEIEDAVSLIDYSDSQFGESDNNQNQAYNNDLVTWDDEGNTYIKAGSKRLGPFQSVNDLYFSPGGNDYAAVVSRRDEDYNATYYLISSSHPDRVLKGEPYEMQVSRSVKNGVVATKYDKGDLMDMENAYKQQALIEEMLKEMEGEEMSMEQIMAFSEKMEEMSNESESNSVEYYVYANDKEFGPYGASYFGGLNPGFGTNSGERWHMIADNMLHINGKPVKDLDGYNHISGFWWSKSGNNYALGTQESVIFSSGQSYPSPIEMKVVEENGNTVLKWLTLENERKFVLYHKIL